MDAGPQASASSSIGLTSTLGLVFGGVLGVTLMIRSEGWGMVLLQMIAVVLIAAGAAARIVQGGH